MPEKLKIGVTVPVWGVLCAIGSLLMGGMTLALMASYYGGTMVTQMNRLVVLAESTQIKADATQAQVERINERQIRGLAQLNDHDATMRNHESRLATLEARSKR